MVFTYWLLMAVVGQALTSNVEYALLTFTNHIRSLLSFSVGHCIYRLSIEGRRLLLSFDMVGRLLTSIRLQDLYWIVMRIIMALTGFDQLERFTGFPITGFYHVSQSFTGFH